MCNATCTTRFNLARSPPTAAMNATPRDAWRPHPCLDELVTHHIILHALALAHDRKTARLRGEYSVILNTLPRSSIPEASHATIRWLPHVDLDFASHHGDLWLLDALWKLSQHPSTRHQIKPQFSTTPNPPSSSRRNTVPGPIAASTRGFVHVLDWWAKHDDHLPLHQSAVYALVAASKEAHLHQVNVARAAQEAVDMASSCGSVSVLQWWHKLVPVAFGCSAATLIAAITQARGDKLGRQVVDWWINESGCQIPHTAKKFALAAASLQPTSQDPKTPTLFDNLCTTWPTAVDSTLIPYLCLSRASDSARLALLRQLCTKHAELVTSTIARRCFQYATLAGNVPLLDWLYAQFGLTWSSQLFLTHTSDHMLIPSSLVTNEWVRCRLAEHPGRRVYYWDAKPTIADMASAMGHTTALEWWMDRSLAGGRNLEYTDAAINQASAAGHLETLKWWADQHHCKGLALKYTAAAMDEASRNGHLHVLRWWRDQSRLVNKVTKWALRLPRSNPMWEAVREYWLGVGMFKDFILNEDAEDSDDDLKSFLGCLIDCVDDSSPSPVPQSTSPLA
ncbi:hypothetical protein BCR44DRAFT_1514832 [Catenaria anguillulae PL171]|uniref:Uncharacterized protein n=1 Tax=Catenaria anguillulae PL171 TaxID=765915 RepID=A0A1Y2HHP2_9FUNG|nr:hypothetical protein BCR44DRAFT_1514832 [Catenaria anguillulae PL171]